jgi:hypothetical protein
MAKFIKLDGKLINVERIAWIREFGKIGTAIWFSAICDFENGDDCLVVDLPFADVEETIARICPVITQGVCVTNG